MWNGSKVTLNWKVLKTIVSETRVDILKALDGKRLNLKNLSKILKRSEPTIHEHLTKLLEAGLVKKIEREGHKWVYYKLSYDGANLLHPENTRIIILLSTALISLIIGISSLIHLLRQSSTTPSENGTHPLSPISSSQALSLYVAIIGFIFFAIFITLSIWRHQKNKEPKL